jgi:hypothetical protein
VLNIIGRLGDIFSYNVQGGGSTEEEIENSKYNIAISTEENKELINQDDGRQEELRDLNSKNNNVTKNKFENYSNILIPFQCKMPNYSRVIENENGEVFFHKILKKKDQH